MIICSFCISKSIDFVFFASVVILLNVFWSLEFLWFFLLLLLLSLSLLFVALFCFFLFYQLVFWLISLFFIFTLLCEWEVSLCVSKIEFRLGFSLNLIHDQHNAFNFTDMWKKEEILQKHDWIQPFFSITTLSLSLFFLSIFVKSHVHVLFFFLECAFSFNHTRLKPYSHEHTTRSFVVSAIMLSEVVLAKSSFYTAIHWDLSDYWILLVCWLFSWVFQGETVTWRKK